MSQLFANGPLSDLLQEQLRELPAAVSRVSPQELFTGSVEAMVEQLSKSLAIVPPTLDLSAARRSELQEIEIGFVDFGRQMTGPGVRITVTIPFAGDGRVFAFRPSSYSSRTPSGRVVGSNLHLDYQWPAHIPTDLQELHSRNLGLIAEYLQTGRADIERARLELCGRLRAAITERRARLSAVEASLRAFELPLQERDQDSAVAGPATSNESARSTVTQGFDAFICHASEDKDVATPLALGLKERGFTVWYDSYELSVGDSIRESIDRGLRNCRFGIVVMSRLLFDKYWTNYELSGLLQRESAGQRVVLPVWRGLSVADVQAASPTLADRVALRIPEMSIDEVLEELAARLRRS